jgi:hypothetical protein
MPVKFDGNREAQKFVDSLDRLKTTAPAHGWIMTDAHKTASDWVESLGDAQVKTMREDMSLVITHLQCMQAAIHMLEIARKMQEPGVSDMIQKLKDLLNDD